MVTSYAAGGGGAGGPELARGGAALARGGAAPRTKGSGARGSRERARSWGRRNMGVALRGRVCRHSDGQRRFSPGGSPTIMPCRPRALDLAAHGDVGESEGPGQDVRRSPAAPRAPPV